MTINPYLNFNGNTEEAFNFYRSVFGGEFAAVMRFKDAPETEKLSPPEQNKIMHIALPVGKGNMLMATDSLESMGHVTKPGTNFHISVSPENKEEAERIFKGLSEGGKITVPIQDMFWGAYFGSLTDKFGIQWMVNYSHQR